MKKIISFIICTLFVCLCFALPVYAWSDMPLLVDGADILSENEEARLLSYLETVSENHGADVAVITVYSLDGKDAEAYADDFYDYNGYAPDGILLLVSTEYSDWHVTTTGFGITAVTDAGLDYMADRFVPYMKNGEFYDAFVCYAELCDEFITAAENGMPYDVDTLPKEPFEFGMTLLISVAVGFVIAFIATGVMRGKLKSVRSQPSATDYVKKDSFQVTRAKELFLYRNVTCVPRPKPQSSSGGSSTHFSSSGTMHGGGGGKF